MNPDWFGRTFWKQLLSEASEAAACQVLHVTGITPLISVNTRAAWDHALEAALSLKQEQPLGSKLIVTMACN